MGQRISQKTLHPLTTVAATTRTACTYDNDTALTGQHGTLYVKVTGASCGTLMFDVEEDPGTGDFYMMKDRQWWANDGAATVAGRLYAIPLDGYSFQSGHKYRFYFTASSAAGKVYVLFVTSDVEHGADVSIGDIEVSLETLDDTVTTDDAANAATKVLMGGIVFDDVAPNTLDEGDAGYVRGSTRRELYTQIRDAAGNERGAVVGGAGELLASVHDGTTKATVTTGTIKGLNVAASDGTTQPVVTTGTIKGWNVAANDGTTQPVVTTGTLKGWNVAANDGTTQPTVTTGTIKAWNVAVSDGETAADVIVTSAAAQPSSIIGAAAEVVDFDTVGDDLTGAIGILGSSATGATPIPAMNAATNPAFVRISQDGTNALAAANPIPVSATMAANTNLNPIYVNTVNTSPVSGTITKTSATAAVAANSGNCIFTSAADGELMAVTFHLSAAPTTADVFSLFLDATAGAEYDTKLYTFTAVSGSTTDIVYVPDCPLSFKNGDKFYVTYANTETRTWGCQFVTRV